MALPSLFSCNIGGNIRIINVELPEASQMDFRISQRHQGLLVAEPPSGTAVFQARGGCH